ncbi:MAG: dTDP-4-dehydrorhamnose reductase [Planctomycetota bacterium]
MKILLLGAGGQLAHDLSKSLAEHEVLPWTRAELDLGNCPLDLADRLKATGAHALVNAAAYNLVDQAETEPEQAYAVNAFGPRLLAKACDAAGMTLCHFSTDYVFGLEPGRGEPWTVCDAPGPVSVYGCSKLAGEYAVRTYCERHFVLRTCGLYGVKGSRGKGGNFVETMLRLAAKGGPLRIVSDQICTPSYTADVARAAAQLLMTKEYGLYHITNGGQSSWHAFASEIFRQAGHAVECQPITSAEFGAAARRPPYSVLSNEKLHKAGVTPPPDWKDALGRYLEERKSGRPSA